MEYKIKPWLHQLEGISKATSQENFALFFEMGAGKTSTCINIIRAKGNTMRRLPRTLIFCPPIVIDNWRREWLAHSNVDPASITCLYGAGKKRLATFQERSVAPHIFITNYESLLMEELYDAFVEWRTEIVVFDECFHGDTLVETIEGEKKIKDIVAGDIVMNCLGWVKVRTAFKNKVVGRIELNYGGRKIICSSNHPFFTSEGWVAAGKLREGDFLANTETCVSVLQKGVRAGYLPKYSPPLYSLFQELWNEVEGETSGVSGIHSGEKSHVQEIDPRQSEQNSSEDEARSEDSRRKWLRTYQSGEYFIGRIKGCLLEFWDLFGGENTWVPKLLQSGSSIPRSEVGYRGGRPFSCGPSSEGTRQKEDREIKFTRLDGHKVLEQGSHPEYAESDFYDLEVEGHPSFTVNGVLVHNCHRLKSHTAKRSKLAERLVNGRMKLPYKNAPYLEGPRPNVYLLSGSPVLNSPMDLFQQYKILDAGQTFTTNFFAFRGRYFRDRNAGMNKLNYFPNWQPNPGALDEIAEKIEPSSMRVLKKDCMDLPPLIRQEILVDMTPGQKKMYDSMLDDFVAYFTKDGKEHVATAELALTKGLRLMQLASGFIKTVEEKEVDLQEGFNPKQEALYELLEELVPHHKVLIWCVWKKNYEQIRAVIEKLGVKHVELTGEQGPAKNMANAKAFEEDGDIRCLIGHPGSGGIGLNLVSASYSIFYSRTFSLEHDLQAEARNYRGGSEQHEKITRIDLVTRGTIEEEVTKKLASKIAIGDTLLKEITLNLRSK